MDYDEALEVLTQNETEFYSLSPELETKILILSTAKLIASTIGFLTDLFIIFIIYKCRSSRTPATLYIMHWLITDALVLFFDPAEYHLYRAIQHYNLPRPYICVIFSSNINARIAEVVFGTIIMMHVYFEHQSLQFFRAHCKKIIASVWIFTFLVVVGVNISCTLTDYDQAFASLVLGVCSSVGLVLFVGVHMKRRFANPYVKGDDVSVALALVTTYFFCWVLYLLLTGAARLMFITFHTEMMMEFFRNIIYLYPLLFLYLLLLLDPKFSAYVQYLFGKKKASDEVVDYSGI